MIIGSLPRGTIGFDCNVRVRPETAKKMYDHGFRFAMRYLRRQDYHEGDLHLPEFLGLLQAGLAVGVVQHVAPENWHPSPSMGAAYGAIAAQEARNAGVPPGVTVWCDLESVSANATQAEIIGFCNEWYGKVAVAGYEPGIYLGYGTRLSAHDAYFKLKFSRYWGAYNLNKDQIPEVRGLAMEQLAYPPTVPSAIMVQKYVEKFELTPAVATALATRVPGLPFQYDCDVVHLDQKGGTPKFVLPK